MTAFQPRSTFRTGLAAILAGVLIFAGQAGELVFGSPSDRVTVVYVLLYGGGVIALAVALWGLRALAGSTRLGRIGVWLTLSGVAVLGLFIIQVMVQVVRTGEVPENFLLFALGFVLAVFGHLLFARGLRRPFGHAWVIPLIAAAGAIVALTVEADPYHDLGLFLFEGAWVALGFALMRRRSSPVPATASREQSGSASGPPS
jgi:hypothetical protein